ncbi:MAG: OmpA family protein [Chitinivibrionales bacterium]|nr:OmpA family protein [Chitinivibrionales bacterium]
MTDIGPPFGIELSAGNSHGPRPRRAGLHTALLPTPLSDPNIGQLPPAVKMRLSEKKLFPIQPQISILYMVTDLVAERCRNRKEIVMRYALAPLHRLIPALVLLAVAVSADNVNTGGQVGIVRTLSARTLGMTGLNGGAALKYDRDWHFVSSAAGNSSVTCNGKSAQRESPHLFSGNLFATYGVASILDIGLNLPLYYDITGWERDRAGVGDLEITAKLAFPPTRERPLFAQAIFCRLILPTGSDDRGYFPRHEYHLESELDGGDHPFTAGAFMVNPMLVWSVHLDNAFEKFPVQLHGNIGAVVASDKSNSILTGAVGLEFTPISLLTVFAEVSGEARVSNYADSWSVRHFENDPLVFTPGARVTLPIGLYVTLAGDIGLSSDEDRYRTSWDRSGCTYATSPAPTYGVQLTVGWSGLLREPDTDGDGIADKRDKCPKVAEDFDAFEDDDGCPDLDDDGDGLPDALDKCPREAAACDGCPVRDKDGDGLTDDEDKCPEQPEDMDGHEDQDGCPDPDNDGDGVEDKADKCVDTPEDVDGHEDDDGCPDVDNDGDGVADEWDKCPNVRGAADNDGCPKTKEIQRGALILRGVNFETGKAVLTPNSYRLLDDVYASLAEWTEVKLEIQGHTDSQGSNEVNQRLSQRRAEAVRDYLIGKGIDPSRLRAVGYGEVRPIADNTTAAGRAKNRRVELHRID